MNSEREVQQTTAQVIKIGIAEGGTVQAPNRLRTTGLGSCVGVVLYDPLTCIAGMVHVMLPSAHSCRELHPLHTKYADLAVPWLAEQVSNVGANPHRLVAKIAGGAQMFVYAGGADLMRIGPRNVEAVLQGLEELRIPLVAQDVGGKTGRTIEFDVITQNLWIQTALKVPYFI
ncbi:chemotaxis protein CheD [Alicyclobacillaceae bacterium I2511]|nr:chemotaxis protein CheD [Alicyclobacillaceae bacterium I2511]